MLVIRIGYGDMVSEQMRIPMSASDYEAVKKILDKGNAENQQVFNASPEQWLSTKKERMFWKRIALSSLLLYNSSRKRRRQIR